MRARSWVDLDAFAERVAAVDVKHRRPEIEVTDGADYPFRFVASRRNVGKVFAEFVASDLSYDNFKDEVGRMTPIGVAYHQVWSTLRGSKATLGATSCSRRSAATRPAMRAVLRFLPIFSSAEESAAARFVLATARRFPPRATWPRFLVSGPRSTGPDSW